ncbi:TPA: hypothetical protein QCR48_003294 [Bacillus cereus]|nr:hypothetical protein [Bacillus cereus]
MGYFRILTVRNYIVEFSWRFQGLDSSTVNFRYVGSYGRETAIWSFYNSDISIIFPLDMYVAYM